MLLSSSEHPSALVGTRADALTGSVVGSEWCTLSLKDVGGEMESEGIARRYLCEDVTIH